MPEISLRAYEREIDELIERERLEEAIAHCRHILQTYAKHLETYRLLGKAYLEAKRYGDAADIFQRVLSAVPDDFVSHVGMAIVREDEGNLDASIWHMERAFETNPSNPAIQQEMKRLISRRDGLEPHKVRLTRGALARMYAHGELFAQAIAELRSALQEDPERPDLQVLLASMYWQTDQRSDATSVSNQILEKLPYCAEANRILAANLQASDRVEEAAVYHRRLASLDPYAAFVESALADSKSIEESAVSLEKLDWVAGEPLPSAAPGQPGWAATLGMEMQEPGEDVPEQVKPPQTGPLPSWLEPGEPPPFEAAAEKELMKDMDPDTSDDLSGSGFLDELEAETPAEAEEMDAEAGFLDELEPQPSNEGDRSEPEADEKPGGLGVEAAAAGIAADILAGGDEDETDETLEAETEISPGGEAAPAVGMFGQSETGDQSESELDLTDSEVVGEAEDILEGAAQAVEELGASEDSEIPDWMQEAGWTESTGEVGDAPISFSDREMEALEAGQVPTDIPEDGDSDLAPAELPEWIHDIAPEDGEDAVGEESLPNWIPSPDEQDAPTAELEAPGKDGNGEASFPTAEPDTSDLPTWITEDSPGATATIVTWLEDKGPDELEQEIADGDELPDWMKDTGPLEETIDSGFVEAEQEPSPEPQTEEPAAETPGAPRDESPSSESWLSAVAAVAAEDDAGPPSSESDGEAVKAPDLPPETVEAPGAEQDLGLAAAAAVGMFAGDDEEETESPGTLDQDVGRDQADAVTETPTSQEDITAEAPSFAGAEQPGILADESFAEDDTDGAEASEVQVPSTTSEAETIDQAQASDAPDWLEEIGTLPEQPVETDSAEWLEGLEVEGEEIPAEAASETPDWLKGLAEEGADGDESGAVPAPDWLREIGDPGSVDQEGEAVDAEPQEQLADPPMEQAAGGAPEWIQGVVPDRDEGAVDEISESVDSEPLKVEEDDEVMDWLEDLAAKQGEAPDDEELEVAAQVVESAPILEDRDIPDEPEEGLEWLEQLADQRGMDVDVRLPGQAAAKASEPEPEPEPDPEPETAPGWLGRMATQPLPKVDMDAVDAAERGEEVSPEAETIDAQAAEIQAQLDEVAPEQEADGLREVAPDDITIEARASDLQAEMEAAAEVSSEEVESVDEIPDWLITAADQAEPPAEAPSGLPKEFAEDAGELEPEREDRLAEPAPGGEQELHPERLQPSEPEPVEEPVAETEPEAAISEAVLEVQELEQEQFPEAVDVEEGEIQPEEPTDLETTEPDVETREGPEFEEPADLETAVAPESEERVTAAETISEEAPAPETKKKEDLLEHSRQALASGDIQAAVEMYGDLVKRKVSLDSVIEDLRIAVDRTPDKADLWQILGDAYMRDDQTDEAIDAYRKGMEAA